MGVIKLMVKGEERHERKIFCEYPHYTWDNYFSGDQKMDWLSGNVFVATITCRSARLPEDIEGQ